MVNFYKDEAGIVMYKDDTYLETMLFVIERPATDEDAIAHPDEHTAFVAAIASVLAPAPMEPTAPASAAESTPTVSSDGVA